MELDKKRCYRALLSRDRRFDGKFFTAVLTTGIYCRPICPATPPRLRNVRFFACAAAAEKAGYRPCRRCHPEAAPGTPAWTGCSATVGRALRLISRGGLDQENLDHFAGRLGVGSRHLRRLFARQLGASPGAISRCRRVHFARNLVAETRLPMAQIAFSSGFSSIRQFNHAFRATFGLSPSVFRRKPVRPASAGNGAVLRLHLPYRPPYDWRGLLEFIRPRLSLGVERIEGGSYSRLVSLRNGTGVIEVRSVRPDGLELSVPVAAAPELLVCCV